MVQTRAQAKRALSIDENDTSKTARSTRRKRTSDRNDGDDDFEVLQASRAPSSLFVWGENSFGQLGLGEAVQEKTRPFPLILGDNEKVVDVAAGGMHTIALTQTKVWSWGVNDEGALGRFTAGRAWEESGMSMEEAEDPTVPGVVQIPAGVGKVVGISAGDDHTLLLTEEGTVWGFGSFRNGSGIMGFSAGVKNQLTPVKIYHPSSRSKRTVKISSGCNHAAALLSDGTVLTWGDGDQGQLGRIGPRSFCGRRAKNRVAQMLTPQAIMISRGALRQDKVVNVFCGAYNTFVLTKNNHVFATGCNNYCQLGEPSSRSVLIFHPHKPKHLQGRNLRTVGAGPHHTLGLTHEGTLLSWGRSCYGRLGLGGVTEEAVSCPRQVHGVEGVEGVSAGCTTSGCFGVLGDMWTWGAQECCLLAKGADEDDEPVPRRVAETQKFANKKVVQMAFGGQHAVCLAVDRMGT